MKLLNTGRCQILAVKVPEGANAWMNDSYHTNTLWYKNDTMRNPKHITLPEGYDYTVLGLADQLTEEQLQDIFPVPAIRPVYGHPFGAVPASLTWEHFRRDNMLYTKNPYGKDHVKHQIAEENTGKWLIIKAERV